jgi:OOP family OmpA-OmpF porin
MKRTCRSLFLAAILLASILLTATACTSPAHSPSCPTGPVADGLAIAVGDRADSPQPSWPGQLDTQLAKIIERTEQQAAQHQTPTAGATFVRVDGRPSIGCVMSYDYSAGNVTAQNADRQAFMSAVHQEVSHLPALAPQADPLTALSRAAAATGPGGTVVLIDSGLQTVAPMDFTKGDLLNADVGTVVAQLKAAGELPDLDGRLVILDGIGYTAPPQAPLDENQRAYLTELWLQIARAAGAVGEQLISTPNTDPAGPGLPSVSTVDVPAPANVQLGCNQQSVLPDDGAVGFMPNSTRFRDDSAARAVLTRMASWLRAHPDASAHLTGSIAHYGTDDGTGLSLARAQRIQSVLAELGAGPGQVTAAGAGWGPFPTKTAPPDPASDQLNRRVIVQITCS